MLRTLRAIIVIGIVWAAAWLPAGITIALYAGSRPPQPEDFLHRPIDGPLFLTLWALWGGVGGTMFALILNRVERRRTLAQLSLIRTAGWGALGAMTLPALLTGYDILRGWAASPLYSWRPAIVSLILSIGLGAGCAVGTLVLARRARA